MFYVVVGLIGMCLASFINVVVYRFPKNEDFIFGHSYCPHCHHKLSMLDMIPVISYFVLKGKCRYCQSYIGIRDTCIEILGSFIAMMCFHIYHFTIMFFISLSLALIFITISLIDYDTMIIDDRFQIMIFMIVVVSMYYFDVAMTDRLLGCLCLTLPFYFFNFYKECIGGADLKIMFMMGWMLGLYQSMIGYFLAVMLACFYSFIKLLLHQVTIKSYIPFAPFLCIGFFISLLFGNNLIDIYLNWL